MEKFVMQMSRTWGKTRKETIQILESDEDELIHQLAFSAVEPLPDWHLMFAMLFESQVASSKMNWDRWLHNWHPAKTQIKEPISSEQLEQYCNAAYGRRTHSK